MGSSPARARSLGPQWPCRRPAADAGSVNVTSMLNIDALAATPLTTDPYEYVHVPGFVRAAALASVVNDFPEITTPGSHPLESLAYGKRFGDLIGELDGPEFEGAVARKFGVELEGRPKIFTVRGMCRPSDGKIHTDTASKIVTVLLYLNDGWDEAGGRLRILRSATDVDDYAEEIPPTGGLLLVFRRSERSFHGHRPFEGRRRAIQMNWVTDPGSALLHALRHRVSSLAKRRIGAR